MNPNPKQGKEIMVRIMQWNGSDNYKTSAQDILKFFNAIHNQKGNEWAAKYFKKCDKLKTK